MYEWDATKTAAENETLLANSEFNYLRPWYSKLYNALAKNGHNVPFGHVYKGGMYSERVLGQKQYELSNHLGNVMAMITDKVSEKKANPGSSLPTLAQKNAALYAAYDYYPFGMLMPERYQEDATSQCIPVTRTRYVKKLVEKYTNSFVSPTDMGSVLAKTAGTTLTPTYGSPGRPGNVAVYHPGGQQAVVEMTLGGASSLSAGKQVRVSTRIDNVQAVHLDVELLQVIGAEEQSLGVRSLTSSEDVVFEATSVSNGALKVIYRGQFGAPGPFKVSVTQFYVVDEVQENYVVQLCNDDEAFGKDYRFGFNGQQKTNEIAGKGNHNTALFWEYDTRLAWRWNTDPVTFASLSPYSVFNGNPILLTDPLGNYSRLGAWWRNKAWGGDGISKVNSGANKGAWGVHMSGKDEEGNAEVVFQTSGSRHKFGKERIQDYLDYMDAIEIAQENGQIAMQDDGKYHREVDGKAIDEPASFETKVRALSEPITLALTGGAPQLRVVKVVSESEEFVNLASAARTKHILAGDATGGGHAWFSSMKSFFNGLKSIGAKIYGGKAKSMFPASWSESKIMHAISEIVVNNTWIQHTGRAGATLTRSGQPVRYLVEGVYEGVKIRVVTTADDIITAFPIK